MTSPRTEKLAGIERRLKAATPGPWLNIGPIAGRFGPAYEVRTPDAEPWNKHYWPFRVCQSIEGQIADVDRANFDLIAHAPSDIAYLLDEIRTLLPVWSDISTGKGYEIQQHVGWLKMYVGSMTPENWRDMQDYCVRQLNQLSALLPSPPVPDGGKEIGSYSVDDGSARRAELETGDEK